MTLGGKIISTRPWVSRQSRDHGTKDSDGDSHRAFGGKVISAPAKGRWGGAPCSCALALCRMVTADRAGSG